MRRSFCGGGRTGSRPTAATINSRSRRRTNWRKSSAPSHGRPADIIRDVMTRGFLHAATAVAIGVAAAAAPPPVADLHKLFSEWRAFQQPKLVDGAPDYSPAAMDAQRRALADYQRRLAALDRTGWPVAAQVDWHIVRAEMNGLDFDLRIRRPWATNPSFYVTVFPEQSD